MPQQGTLNPLKGLAEQFEQLVRHRLWLKVLIALGLGVMCGIVLGPDLAWFELSTVATLTAWLALPGQVFLALIQMIVVPLVLASIVRGLAANNNPAALKHNGMLAVAFIVVSTALAAIIGISLALQLQPGAFIDASLLMASEGNPAESVAASASGTAAQGFPAAAELPEKVSALIPRNPLASMASGEMLQVILFAVVLGLALLSIPARQAQPLFDVLHALQEVCLRVVSWAMVLAPYAVFGLITRLVASLGLDVLAGMLVYVVTVLLGLLVVAAGYLLVVRLCLRGELRHFVSHMKELLLLAFSTSSSAAVMPLSLQLVENKLAVRPEVARFLIPLGATINMTGTALYQGVATVFLAQVFSVELSLTSYLFVVTMAVAASIGSPATPGAGIIILSMVLEGVGIPAAGVALILGVDRILDMARTSINVLGDVVACVVVDRLAPAGGERPPVAPQDAELPEPEPEPDGQSAPK